MSQLTRNIDIHLKPLSVYDVVLLPRWLHLALQTIFIELILK